MEYQNFIKSFDVDINKASKFLKQYLTIKRENAECIIFFRLGDFYETYFEDAVVLSKVCGVLLTKRKFTELGDVLMAGVPHKNSEIYIQKLVAQKYKVSIVEQVQAKEDVKKGDIIKREVIRTYSPGTLIEGEFLEASKNNFIASVLKNSDDISDTEEAVQAGGEAFLRSRFKERSKRGGGSRGNFPSKARYGLSYADVSTGEFFITEGELDEILCELSKIQPSELLLKIKTRNIETMKPVPEKEADIEKCIYENYPCTVIGKDLYNLDFTDPSLEGCRLGLLCANSIINYSKTTQKKFMPKLDNVKKYSIQSHLIMNLAARENLELNANSFDNKKYGSIVWALDNCKTFMGKRLLSSFLNEPLYDVSKINERLDGVCELISNGEKREKLSLLLDNLSDISRLSSKLSNGTIMPKELLAIKDSLKIAEEFKDVCSSFKSKILKTTGADDTILDFRNIIERSIKEEPSNYIKSGGIIKEGANGMLDNLRAEIEKTKIEIENYENELVLKSGVKNLKISYAKNTGYSIDVPISSIKTFKSALDDDVVHKQKLSSYEKFGTKRLSVLEDKMLSLLLKSYELEFDIYSKLREYAKELTLPLRDFAFEIALKDVLLSFAIKAIEGNFTRPKFTSGIKYCAKKAYHPVLLKTLPKTDALDIMFSDNERIKLITGANMSGKSTYLRELGALVIMAQAGSYVPAEDFELSLVDKIFARMGSYDDMLNKNSAFMCEMLEIAGILNNAGEKSLILLDETGKSTSYKDGISSAYGVIKYIGDKVGARCAFATHFHSLHILEDEIPSLKNYKFNLENDPENGGEIFKRTLERGYTDDSMGLQTMRSAGVPDYVFDCAERFSLLLNKRQ